MSDLNRASTVTMPTSHLAGHYFVPHPTLGTEWYLAFELERCEWCGHNVQGANTVNVHGGTDANLIAKGLRRYGQDTAPPEQFLIAEGGQWACLGCCCVNNARDGLSR